MSFLAYEKVTFQYFYANYDDAFDDYHIMEIVQILFPSLMPKVNLLGSFSSFTWIKYEECTLYLKKCMKSMMALYCPQ